MDLCKPINLDDAISQVLQNVDELATNYERAEQLQNLLVALATGGTADAGDYQELRLHFLHHVELKTLLPLPDFVRVNRDLSQFWQYIKFKFPTYAERRDCIWSAFKSLLDLLEQGPSTPSDKDISAGLLVFGEEGVHEAWSKALERRTSDPEGAITAARTLVESVCKHILEEQGVPYDGKRIELHELYRLTSTELNLSLSQHSEEVFKQILGGCSAVVSGLGNLRNRLGDAHGKGKQAVRPAPRHAGLAVSLAGSLALFLVETWKARIDV